MMDDDHDDAVVSLLPVHCLTSVQICRLGFKSGSYGGSVNKACPLYTEI
jgi:hypothetical protein